MMRDEPRPSGGVFLCLLLAVSSPTSRSYSTLQKKGAAEAAPESKDCFLALLLEFHFVFETHLVFEFHLVCNDNVVGVFHALCFDCHAQL